MTVHELALAKGFTEEYLRSLGVRDGLNCVEVPYYNADGSLHPRYRKRFNASGNWAWNKDDAGEPTTVYGLHRPVPFEKGFVWIVEGESDCWALWSAGLPALGIPGASNTSRLRVEHVRGAEKIYVVQEPGEAGSLFPSRAAAKLHGEGFEGAIYAVELPEKDPRALMLADPEKFVDRLREAARKATIIQRPETSASPSPSKFPPRLSARQLLELGNERVEYLIEGLLPKAGIGINGAKQKVGKSVLSTNATFSVARGREFLGRRCRQGPVLYLSLDEPKHLTVARFEAAGLRDEDPIQFHLGVAPVDWVPWLRSWLQDFRPALLVIDTIAKLIRPQSMDNYAEVNSKLEPLIAMRNDFGVAQLWLTHNTKHGEGTGSIQGSIAWTAAVDTTIIMTKNPDGVRTLFTEQRVGDNIEPSVLRMNEDDYTVELVGEKNIVEQRAAEQKILDRMQPGQLYDKDELVAAAGKRLVLGRKALGALIDAGLIIADGSGKRGDPWRYKLGGCPSGTSGQGNSQTVTSSPKKPVSMSHIYKDIADRETHLSPDENFPVPDVGTPRDQAGQGWTPQDLADSPDIADRETENAFSGASDAFDELAYVEVL